MGIVIFYGRRIERHWESVVTLHNSAMGMSTAIAQKLTPIREAATEVENHTSQRCRKYRHVGKMLNVGRQLANTIMDTQVHP